MAQPRTGFPAFVNQQLPPASPGDFASANPRASVLSNPAGAYQVAEGETVLVGNFAWFNPTTGLAYGVKTAGAMLGFVRRSQGLTVIVDFLGFNRSSVQEGFAIDAFNQGDFWANFPSGAAQGATVYADDATGQPTTNADSGNNPDTGFVVKTAIGADSAITAALTITGAGAPTILNVSAVASGTVEPGMFINGTGVPDFLRVISQLSGTLGGIGTYLTSVQGVAITSQAFTLSHGKLAKISSW